MSAATAARPLDQRLALVPAVTPPPLLRQVLGARLRRARTAQGRSLRDIAAAAGVSLGHLSQVERGLTEASSEVLAAVCGALGLPLHALLRAAAMDLTAATAARVSPSLAPRSVGGPVLAAA